MAMEIIERMRADLEELVEIMGHCDHTAMILDSLEYLAELERGEMVCPN